MMIQKVNMLKGLSLIQVDVDRVCGIYIFLCCIMLCLA